MPEGWQALQLKSFCDFIQGGRKRLTKQNYLSSGFPAFSAAGQDGFVDVPEFHDTDAVILSAIGANCGRCFLASGDWTTLANVQAVVPRAEQASARFLHYRVNRDDYWPRSGSAQPFIKPSDMKLCWLALPPLPQQEVIGSVLKVLDTAIHETEALIAKLKAVKQGLLHDLLTRGIDANGELRPPHSEAPHLYKSSPLGWIPCNWEAGPLQLWLSEKPKNGYSPKEAGEWTGCQMLGLGCLTSVGFEPSQLKNAPFADARLDSVMLSDGDLLMSRANTRQLVGLVGVYADIGTPCAYPDLMMRLKPTVGTSAQYLQFVLRSPMLRRQIQAHAVGTSESMVKISGRIVRDLVVAMPDGQEQARILDALSADSTNLDSELKVVSALRDLKFGLMDDLLTGRVRVTPLLDAATA
ncbi:hypothetical protein IA54_010540 [Xanthomonas phaseoli pv. syngonii LMG 9055]|uniref:Type I restriction modification DNA specificity domain-containing protein n=1 Tax=Xanthomonas phaseoli pv. syngonii LMG 9055 TaxID=1437878 RepID=A0A1V9GYH3_9XANT|nr:hypothetical protein IA54_010540 [Xanthomonas phaseoli pv. syngonii LMG 9055]